ncbi:hypothetical protein [Enterobacter cloacae complex sp. 301C7]|uniref:hypothetical protein n=1 Tax=Enterobacter cloacae complex sp. 301C7 TaxID=3395848 RepID=UPI003CECFBF4
MSSLIFYTDEAQALIVTDTLAVTDNGEPLSFVSKAGYIPQLRTIIAGTGAGGFSDAHSEAYNQNGRIRYTKSQLSYIGLSKEAVETIQA